MTQRKEKKIGRFHVLTDTYLQTNFSHVEIAELAIVGGADTIQFRQKDGATREMIRLRTYYAAPGKLDDLVARFRNHTTRLFEKHGIVNVGYWLPLTNTENKLLYVLAFPSREAPGISPSKSSAPSRIGRKQ